MTAQQTNREVVHAGHPRVRRIGLIGVGVIFVLAGVVAWGWETEYGSGHGFSVEVIGDEATVYDTVGDSGNVVVFVGSRAEAEAYTEAQRTTGRNYTISALILAAGGAIVLVGVWPRSQRGVGATALVLEREQRGRP